MKSLNPDLMLYGGDIVDGKNTHPELGKITDLLKRIKPRFGVFGVLGNHEFYRGHTDGAFFRQAGSAPIKSTSKCSWYWVFPISEAGISPITVMILGCSDLQEASSKIASSE